MKFINILDDLAMDNGEIRILTENIANKNKKTDKAIIESLTKVAYILYALDDIKNAELVTDKLASIPFNNDYDYWTWIEYAICLRATISQVNGDSKKFDESIEKIREALNYGEGLQKKVRINVHARFMQGDNVEPDGLTILEKEGDLAEIFEIRLIYLMKLIKLKVLGGSTEYPVGRAIENINYNVHEIKSLIINIDDLIKNVRPFR